MREENYETYLGVAIAGNVSKFGKQYFIKYDR